MNRYQSQPPYRDTYAGQQAGSMREYRTNSSLLDNLQTFVQEYPGLALAGAALGGFLLARYLRSDEQHSARQRPGENYRPMWSYAPDTNSNVPNAYRGQPEPSLSNRPADHMGATEEQMSDRFADPSPHELEEGATGTTGTVYELDRNSITAG